MSFVAILNTKSNLDRLVAQGDRPTAVATWSSAVHAAAQAYGIPSVLEDEVIPHAERVAMHDRADDLSRALAGNVVPPSEHYSQWCWWALELPLVFAFAYGARTLKLFEALRTLAPDHLAVVSDRDGYLQGAITNFLGRRLGLETFSFEPHSAERDTMHQRLDVFSVPLFTDKVREIWQGKKLGRDDRPRLLMIHTNEVAHLVPHLATKGVPHFLICEDARTPWPEGYRGPRVDARPAGPASDLVVPEWPAALAFEAEDWERELAETIAMTWQPKMREEFAWARAAFEAAELKGMLGGGTWFPEVRCRVLACRDLGIQVIMTQHGMLHARHGGRGERVQHFADHQLEWSRVSGADLASWGAGGETHVIGWPQSSLDRSVEARKTRQRLVASGAMADGPWVILTSAPLPDEPYGWGEQTLKDALTAIRAVDPARRILVKHHPFQEPGPIVAALVESWGFTGVDVVGGLDPWIALQDAHRVVAFKSTAVLCAIAMDVPVVVHLPAEEDAMFDRFPGFPVTRSVEALIAHLRGEDTQADYAAARRYARTDIDAGTRAVAALRRILAGPPARRRRLARRREVAA